MYALTCECGETVPVSLRQAGNEVSCPACSNRLQVPKLGELRNSPQIASPSDQELGSSSMGMGWRLAFAGLCLLAGFGLLVGTFSLISATTIEVGLTTEEHIASDIERLQHSPPALVAELWRESMMHGLNERHPFLYKQQADEKAAWMQRGIVGMSVAGIALVLAIALARTGRSKPRPPTGTAAG